jgi:hypothetical protein
MFTPSQDDRETLGQGLRLPGALRDLRKDAFWPLEPGIQTGEMRPVPVPRDGGCFVLWALPGPFARLQLPSRGHWSPAKDGGVKLANCLSLN